MEFPTDATGDDVGHLLWIRSVNVSELGLVIAIRGHEEEVMSRGWAQSRFPPVMVGNNATNKTICILTFMKERFEKSNDDLE